MVDHNTVRAFVNGMFGGKTTSHDVGHDSMIVKDGKQITVKVVNCTEAYGSQATGKSHHIFNLEAYIRQGGAGRATHLFRRGFLVENIPLVLSLIFFCRIPLAEHIKSKCLAAMVKRGTDNTTIKHPIKKKIDDANFLTVTIVRDNIDSDMARAALRPCKASILGLSIVRCFVLESSPLQALQPVYSGGSHGLTREHTRITSRQVFH